MPGHRLILTSLSLLMLASAAGCKNRSLSTEADGLRRRVIQLEDENEQLRRRQAELRAELDRETNRPGEAPPEIRDSTPHVVGIALGRLSHVRDTNDDGVPDTALIYVDPIDGLGRFVQMVGRVSVHAMLVPPDADALTVGRRRLEPQELRAAYRSGFSGTHYTIELPLDLPSPLPGDSCLIRVLFEDGQTGQKHESERSLDLNP